MIYCRMHLLCSATCLVLVIGTTSGLGDRFAWSPVEVAEDTREGKLVAEVDEVVRNVRKVAEEEEKESKEQIEGRFVGKEVLCSLGLADCSPKLSDVGIQYVQPVKVVPYGDPVAAVDAQGQFSVPVDSPHGSDRQFNTGYGAPSTSYGAPKPSYGAPKPSYGAPKPTYGAPSSSYGPPKPSYEAPSTDYGAPSTDYGAPAPVYAPPPAKYGGSSYGAPSAPVVKASNVRDQRETDFQTSFNTNSGSDVSRPTREGRLDECYCVPVAQCPSNNIVGGVFKDYSALINPRVKASDVGIEAHKGRSNVEVVSVSASAPRAEGEKEEADKKTEEEEITRKRRNRLSTDQDQPQQSRLSNVFIPDDEEVNQNEEEAEEDIWEGQDYEYEEDDLFLSRDGADIDIGKLNKEERLKRRAQRRAERQAKRRAALAAAEAALEESEKGIKDKKKKEDDKDILAENADLVEAVGQDKSFDSLSSFTDDIGEKVGSVGSEVSSGATRLLGGLANLITGSTSNGQLQPTVGVSFGLPQAGPGYGGYQQNPVGTGGAVNPYYTGADGVEVGPVNLNPLFSFQAATNDDGELALKPLVNLHLTPNGCGVLGCDKATYDYVDYTLKSIPNPLDAVKSLFAESPDYSNHGVYGDYTVPKPSYLPPGNNYGVPSTGYGAPSSGYGAPSTDYGAPSTDYGAPKPSYNGPQTTYNPPQPSYNSPSVASQQTIQNIHHHYHHQGSSDFLRENNQVKRNTESGFIPMEGITKPQSSGGAFRFPRTSSRGGRKLELPEETEELDEPVLSGFRFSKEKGGRRLDIDVEEDSEEEGGRRLDVEVQEDEIVEDEVASEKLDSVEVVYSEETAPQGGKVKFVERRKRSPDGDHHGHHGHHGAHHGSQPFGPNGVRPPTCGGPASGYVCCRNAVASSSSTGSFSSPALDFNELAPASSIRDVRQQPQQFNGVVGQFSSYGQCGKRNAHGVTGRINNPAQKYNEGDTEFGEYPWQAAILKKEEYDNVYVCGGSLIDSSHIPTAAHCIKQYRPEELRIRLGEWDVNNDSEFYPNIELDVLSISIHPEFYSGNLYNDIAIIKLDGFLDFQRNPHISPVCLPDSLAEFSGERCFVSGWGKDAFGGDGSYQHTLKEVDVPVLDHGDCERKLQRTRLGYEFTLHSGFVCAGGEEGKDSCKGDGGSPLVCQVGGSWQLAGLVSWGVGCGQRDVPGVYVKVSEYNQWIQEMMLTT